MTGITREDVAKVILSAIEDAVWSDDGRLDNMGVDGPCDLLAVADAVMLLLYAPGRIDEAVAKERERCEREARRYAGFYPPHSDGRNTFAMLADFIAAGRPTPTTEEGA